MMPPLNTIDDFLTVAQVAQMYHLRDSTIRTYIKKGLLPAQKTPGGKNWLIRESDAAMKLSLSSSALNGAGTPERLAPLVPVGVDPLSASPISPLIDRLGTPEGRARAIAALRALREEDQEGEQEAAWEVLKNGVTPLSLRRWSPDDGEASEQTA